MEEKCDFLKKKNRQEVLESRGFFGFSRFVIVNYSCSCSSCFRIVLLVIEF